MDTSSVEAISRSPEETQQIGRVLGANAQPGQVLLLVGELGSGKTCLTQGLLWGLGGDEHARSPTFVLVSEYRARLMLYHIDLYRLEAGQDGLDLGLEEYLFGDGVCVVEWADRAPDLFPPEHLKVRIERLGERTRRLSLSSGSPEYADILSAVRPGVVASGPRPKD